MTERKVELPIDINNVECVTECWTFNRMAALKQQDYKKFASRMKQLLNTELIILDDFLLHTITEEKEVKILFELLEKRNEQGRSTIVCSQRDPDHWTAMILNDEVSANSILKRATKHYTIMIKAKDNQ